MNKLGYLLAAAACGALTACASGGSVAVAPASEAPDRSAEVVAAEDTGLRLTALAVSGNADQSLVQLTAASPLSIFSSYNPEPTLVVVDVPNGNFDDSIADALPQDPRIRSVRLTRLTEFGRPFARLEVRLAEGLESQVDRSGNDLILRVSGGIPAAATPAPVEEVAVAEPAVVSEPLAAEPASVSPPAETTASAEPVAAEPVSAEPVVVAQAPAPQPAPRSSRPSGKVARNLEAVRVATEGDSVVLDLVADGGLPVNEFFLENPTRLVFDIDGVTNAAGKKNLEVGQGGVGRVRVSQFQVSPKPVSRVVIDLDRKTDYTIEASSRGARIVLGAPKAVESIAAARPAEPAPTPVVEPKAAPVAEPVRVAAVVEPEPVEPVRTEPVVAPAPAPAPAAKPAKSTAAESALFEAAEAYLADSKSAEVGGGKFEPKNLAPPEQTYVGEPISLHLKDNDIRDVLRTISNLTGLNIVVDPEVQGRVTIDLEEVPWDQALELMLKVNGLSYQLDGNVMRIGTVNRLKSEEEARRRLMEEKELSQPQETYVMTLSYAKAEAVLPLVQEMLSKRGNVITDARTNKLIIQDIHDYLQRAISLVEKVDIPNEQVVIEARIVETTKNFSRQLGIRWGFLGQADAAHGNELGYQFPYDGSIAGGVGLGVPSNGVGGGPLLALALGDILDSFNLDIALSAAEAEGIAKIVSSPKVATETNFAAKIQSGVQIPIQTSANNTTTVSYIDATLSLEVTPQITAQGTIIMDIKVQKRAPLPALTVTGGTNVPLSTREATTRLLVKDGGTAVIGGIYEIADNDGENRVPGLGSLPFIGHLFKNSSTSKKHDELLIFITPRIVKG